MTGTPFLRRNVAAFLLVGLLPSVLPGTPNPVGSPPAPPAPPPGHDAPDAEIQQLRQELLTILTSTGNREGRWAVLAVSLDRGDTLLALNPREPMVPASNMKLLTTAAAMELLGPEFRYRTFLLGAGEIEAGTLDGDLILYGTGDPSLSDRFYPDTRAPLDSLAARLSAAGVTEIRGDLVIDGSHFPGPELHPDWDPRDFNDTFAAPVSSVLFNENFLTVQVAPAIAAGRPARIQTSPPSAGLSIVNEVRTVARGSGSRVWLFRETPWDPIGVEGQIPLGGRDVWRRLPVPDPLRFTGIQLALALRDEGIRLRGRIVTVRDPGRSTLNGRLPGGGMAFPAPQILASLESPPLLEILRVVNKESNNLLAETVGKTLGRVVAGNGSFTGGQDAIRGFLLEEVGISPEELSGRDGSGLSPLNRVSASALIRLLDHMASSPNWEDFLATLPVAGTRRELGRMYRSPAAGNLRAKTGTMDGVSALSGIVATRSGERVLFSILSNEVASEYRAKRAEDQLGIRLASLTRPLPN